MMGRPCLLCQEKSEDLHFGFVDSPIRRLLSMLVVGPLSAAAGFYVAVFAYRLITQLLFYAASVGLIVLYLLGFVSNSTKAAAAPLLLLEVARKSGTATCAAGVMGALAALALLTRIARVGSAPFSWRSTVRFEAVVVGVAGLALCADLWLGVTPYVDRLMPHSDFASARRDVTCRLSVAEIAQLRDNLSGCVAEVEGILVYSSGADHFDLCPEGARYPSIKVYFYRGRRTLFSAMSTTAQPRYFNQVSPFVGKRVRIIGQAVNGQVSADVGHIVLADERSQ